MSVLFLELLMGIFKMTLFASLSTMALLNCILTAVKIVLMTINDCIGGRVSAQGRGAVTRCYNKPRM